ncbi:hypothetical protein [Hymenobacter sp. BT491]|nr:hypothetical protein [Hymenobacter sp. BT491]
MYIPYVWHLTAEDGQRAVRFLKIYFYRALPRFRRTAKTWSY